jgi:CheY-specific phosphatase CheX
MTIAVAADPINTTNSIVHPFVGTFARSTKKVFSTMMGCEIVLADQTQNRGFLSEYNVSEIIGFSGNLRGTLVVSCAAEMTYSARKILFRCRANRDQ